MTHENALEQIIESIRQLRESSTESFSHLRDELHENTRKTDRILKAFPNDDTDGHRSYHEEIIQSMADKRKLRQELITHLLKTSSWAALVGACIALATYFKIWIKS